MSATELVRVIVEILAFVGIGIALRASGLLKAEDARPLNAVLIYVGLPALIFTRVHAAEIGPEMLLIPAVGWAATLLALGAAWSVTRALKLPAPTAGAFILVAALGNTGYIGYPVALALLGDAGLVRAIFFDVFATVVAALTLGVVVASRMGEHDLKVNPVRELVTFPPMIALVFSLALRPVPVPEVVSSWLGALATLVVPLIMISVGVSLKPGRVREHLALSAGAGVIKLVGMPLVALVLGGLVFSDAETVRLVVIQAGVPSMMLSLVIGMRYRLDTDFIACAILLTTIGAILTIPLMQLLAG